MVAPLRQARSIITPEWQQWKLTPDTKTQVNGFTALVKYQICKLTQIFKDFS